jgi:uncharacterized protein YggE
MTRHTRQIAAAVMSIAAWQTAATAQTVPTARPTTLLTLNVEGRTARVPDMAEVSGGVVTAAPTAADAMSQNAERMTAVVAAVRQAGVAERDIQTSGLSLQPQYRYVNNQPPELTGYQATNTVNLRIRRIADTGKLLDTLVKVGANQISGPVFRIEDDAAALDEARLAAVKAAKARAELYARATGLNVRRIVTMAEGGGAHPEPRPMLTRMMADAAPAAAPPVAPGEVALSINLNVVFELD